MDFHMLCAVSLHLVVALCLSNGVKVVPHQLITLRNAVMRADPGPVLYACDLSMTSVCGHAMGSAWARRHADLRIQP